MALNKKDKKTSYNQNGKILRMTFLKFLKTKKFSKTPENKNLTNLKSHVRMPQMKKVQKTNYSQNGKILRMTFSEISKTKK